MGRMRGHAGPPVATFIIPVVLPTHTHAVLRMAAGDSAAATLGSLDLDADSSVLLSPIPRGGNASHFQRAICSPQSS